jgi:hypothetical protein
MFFGLAYTCMADFFLFYNSLTIIKHKLMSNKY